jgi:ATP-binding protein involved in chromosome partitioning
VSPASHALAIASGKGGVGKSTAALNLSLALRDGGTRVELLDADFYRPDIPLMVNLGGTDWGELDGRAGKAGTASMVGIASDA